jgi:hypothetical protein
VNNGGAAYPWIETSFAAPQNPPNYLVDGSRWYHQSPANRWTTVGSPNGRDTVTIDFGAARRLERVVLYPLDDGPQGVVRTPANYQIEIFANAHWVSPSSQKRRPAQPEGHRANTSTFTPIAASRLRVILTPQPGAAVGLTELETWGTPSLDEVRTPPRDLAFDARLSASYTAPDDRIEQLHDLQIAFSHYSRNRWSALGTPNASDWVEVAFDAPKRVSRIELYLWGDGDKVRAPRSYAVQYWDGSAYRDATVRSRLPARPLASDRNVVTIDPVTTSRVRLVLEHDLPAVTAITELVVLP